MDIKRLLSGLNELPSFEDRSRVLFEKNRAIPLINTTDDVSVLLALSVEINMERATLLLPKVNLGTMKVHATVIKPFVSETDEDDFI